MPSLTLESPVGHLRVSQVGDAIIELAWVHDPAFGAADDRTDLLDEAVDQLRAYFAGERQTFDLPLAPRGTVFQKRVYAAMSAIEYGATRTYGDIAHELNSAARAVGRACGSNPIPIIIPCHRVLAASGRLGGYSGSGGTRTKQTLLSLESREFRLA
jgi:methylated-DNA-[protein]-cysteine S-methyltransferase